MYHQESINSPKSWESSSLILFLLHLSNQSKLWGDQQGHRPIQDLKLCYHLVFPVPTKWLWKATEIKHGTKKIKISDFEKACVFLFTVKIQLWDKAKAFPHRQTRKCSSLITLLVLPAIVLHDGIMLHYKRPNSTYYLLAGSGIITAAQSYIIHSINLFAATTLAFVQQTGGTEKGTKSNKAL